MSGEYFAIKTLAKSTFSAIDELKSEIDLMREVDHPNIIKLVEVFEDSHSIHLVQELCTGGELFDAISQMGGLPEAQAKKIMFNLLGAVNYCHEKGIVHRDLKVGRVYRYSYSSCSHIIYMFGLAGELASSQQ
jgi:calcium-dependent protein kinase